jgi:DNA polymerase III, delta subunit
MSPRSTASQTPSQSQVQTQTKTPSQKQNVPLTPQEFDRQLKSGALSAYLFYGNEEYLARVYRDKLRAKITGGDAEVFNHAVLDGDTYSPGALADEILMLPVMADCRFIEVKGVSFAKADAVEGLCSVLEILPDCPHVVVLIYAMGEDFDAGSEKQPSKTLAALSGCLVPVCFSPETPARLAQWIARHFEAEGVGAPQEICARLVAFSGRDMTTLAGEIDKLAAFVLAHGRSTVTEPDIREVCGAVTELDSFALANAVLQGDSDAAMTALTEALSRREKPELLLASISRVFCDLYAVRLCADEGMGKRDIAAKLKLHEYKAGLYVMACRNHTAEALAAAVERCREADLKLKSTQVASEVILTRLALSKI